MTDIGDIARLNIFIQIQNIEVVMWILDDACRFVYIKKWYLI